jgi:transmembrane sensor
MAKEGAVSAPPPGAEHERIALEAAAWIVARDRGLDAGEAEEFRRWCAEPRHAAVLAEREREWRRFDLLADAPPAQATGRPWIRRLAVPLGIAAAAAVIFRFAPGPASAPTDFSSRPTAAVAALPAPVPEQRRFLADGSVIDLGPGATAEVAFADGERRIRLLRGAARFTVAHDAARPFVVRTDSGIEVRALGTVFDVWLEAAAVDVRVASGRVQVRAAAPAGGGQPAREIPVLGGGQRVVVPVGRAGVLRVERAVAAVEETERPQRYEFERTPLARAVAELNRRGDVRLAVDDPELAALPIYASFRGDNIEAFLRLLEGTGEVAVERDAGTFRLKPAR